MKIEIVARNFKVTKAIESIIEGKLKKFKKYFGDDADIKITLETNRYGQSIDVLVNAKGKTIKSKCTDSDLYTAIDNVFDKLKNQAERFSNKTKAVSTESIKYSNSHRDNIKTECVEEKIVKRKVFNLKPMFEGEAILQMELLNHESFLFFNAEIDKICMMYKRKDGNYGIIEGM